MYVQSTHILTESASVRRTARMHSRFLLDMNGYLHLRGVLTGSLLATARAAAVRLRAFAPYASSVDSQRIFHVVVRLARVIFRGC